MNLLDGKLVRNYLLNSIKEIPKDINLAVIQVGNNQESSIYINSKRKLLESLNIRFNLIKFKEDISEEKLIETIDDLNKDDKITGILIEMPLPSNLDTRKIVNTINEYKDVDGLTDINLLKLRDNKNCITSPTALSVINILDYYKIDVENKNVVIIGRSALVGKPLEYLMKNRGANVFVCHSKTKNISDITIKADILISATGHPNLVTGDMIKNNAVIVDVGITKIDNKIYGDVDFNSVKDKVSYITPVPGGVGILVSTVLAFNLIRIQENNK